MKVKTTAEYRQRATMLKALAHPTRLLIVDELGEAGERCVCELTELVGADMSTVSRHLAQLRNAGIVEDERRGAKIFYKLRFPCLGKLFECLSKSCDCSDM
ncbi:MAG: winged helix-turn-helix transcriptional regulator [Pirellulales bacterium]|nr:winged helix-turn-helix transcriptional regulator [Pirellulales bacterium]